MGIIISLIAVVLLVCQFIDKVAEKVNPLVLAGVCVAIFIIGVALN